MKFVAMVTASSEDSVTDRCKVLPRTLPGLVFSDQAKRRITATKYEAQIGQKS